MAEFANQYGINLPAIGAQWQAEDANALRQMLGKKQLAQYDREEQNQNALAQYLPGAMQGDDDAFAKVVAAKPELGVSLMNQKATLAKQKREQAMKEAPIYGRAFSGVKDQASYDQARAALAQFGVADADKLPPQYNPAVVQKIIAAAKAISPTKFDIKEGEGGFFAIDQENPTATPTRIPGMRPKATGDDRQLVEVYDEKSPTGTRFVPRAQASGMPGKPASGLAMRTNADGTVEIVQGRNAGSPGFGQKATNDIETNMVNTTMRIARVGDILNSFNPNFLTYEGQIKNWGRGVLEKIDPGSLGPDGKKELADFATFRSRAYNDLTQTLKEISGGAVTPQEAERNLKVLGDAESDSPTVFMAKVKEIYRQLRFAQARLGYMRSNGVTDLKQVPLEKLPSLMQERETALANELKAANPSMDAEMLKGEVRARLQKEFGL